ncbi:AraE family aromatic acid exporter [Caballeronia mineralivorans PML1(12)]|uniref:AraE family aromatic acid exporter n=1 Tax=Caballeronia mineralivorans PML1(12) TaxID=908627 RepID=A0A0J1CMY9_9BURK|nr:FUSC family membrane protein [Caballeronia mineralivorans]KLU22072.1 AraE family aromatic acid exporter [Caballeronia mineralivorans PML1(12)]
MRYSLEIRKFIYSQYFFGGLRIALGVSLPAILMLTVFHNRELGFTIATGALGASVVDMPGPLKYKHNEMLACTVIGFLSALATGIASANAVTLWLSVVPLTFVLSLIVVYGNRWPQISFATLFMMIVTLEEHFTPMQALVNASWILLGGLWYTYWATFVSRSLVYRIERQALAESVFSCAEYLLARSEFYDLDANLDECYRKLIEKQIAAVERQDAARDIVLRNLPKLRSGKLDARRVMLFNLFINVVDLHEMFVGAHTDYPLVRNTFGGADILIFYRDLMRKAALDLEDIGLAVLQNRPARARINVKAELRAIEYELDQMRRHGVPQKNPEAYSAVSSAFRRLWSATRLIDKMRRRTRHDPSVTETEIRVDPKLSRFVSSRRVPFMQIFSNLTMASPSFRHALRVTIAVGVGFWLGRLLPLTNAYWIVMTTVIILKPGYSLTKQRNVQRIIGTAIGCAACVGLILVVKNPHVLLVAMFACMVMSYSLLLFNYTASVVFTSAYVLLMLHLLAPGGMRLIGERAIDTVVGCAIAIAASHLFPYWEYRLMGKQVRDMIAAMRNYLEASWWWTGKPAAQAEAKSAADANLFADANAATAEAATAALARSEAGEAELATAEETSSRSVLSETGGETGGVAGASQSPVVSNVASASAETAISDRSSPATRTNEAITVRQTDPVSATDTPGATYSAAPVKPTDAATTRTPGQLATRREPALAETSGKRSTTASASKKKTVTGESAAATAKSGASAAAAVAAEALDSDFRYRLARKNVHIAFANLAQAFQRMMLEPKAQQKFVPELNDLLIRSHVLASQITAAGPLLQSVGKSAAGHAAQPVQRALTVIRDNLTQAQEGVPVPDDQAEQSKLLTRELDSMVVGAERAEDIPADAVQDLKLLAHQCKQMLTASLLIRKDASLINLPE